jgi:hypothetical protein
MMMTSDRRIGLKMVIVRSFEEYRVEIAMNKENYEALCEWCRAGGTDLKNRTERQLGDDIMWALRTHAFPEEMKYSIT